MPRKLTVLFRRDPSRDRQDERIRYEGYEMLWPDGHPVGVGFEAFCTHGQRLLSLGRHLSGCRERLLDLLCFPLSDREDDLTRLPGHRVRRFYMERHGRQGNIHFLDGTPTAIQFDMQRDEHKVLQWIGLPSLREGEQLWFDIATAPTNVNPLLDDPALRVAAAEGRFEDATF